VGVVGVNTLPEEALEDIGAMFLVKLLGVGFQLNLLSH